MDHIATLLVFILTFFCNDGFAQNFSKHLSSSEGKLASSVKIANANPEVSDDQHWDKVQNSFGQHLAREHFEQFPLCKHHADVILMLAIAPITPGNHSGNGNPNASGEMVFVEGGSFQMGGSDWESHSNEKPVHEVTVDDFYIGKSEVTFAEFDAFCRATGRKKFNDGGWGRKNRPAINVNWFDAIAYCNWLSEQHHLEKVYTIVLEKVTANWSANGYRLPTEAEWEFAARSRGNNDKWAGTSSETALLNFANYWDSEELETDPFPFTAPVNSFAPNALGLHDMSGNVWEWCWDRYGDNYYKKTMHARNPKGPEKGSMRVRRGGSWSLIPASARCVNRYYGNPVLRYRVNGFRVVRNGGSQ